MNGVVLRPSDATPADPERFVSRAGGLFQHVERVAAWSRRTLAATLESMPGVDGATTVSLATYLEVARRVGSKDDRFRGRATRDAAHPPGQSPRGARGGGGGPARSLPAAVRGAGGV